MLQKFKIFSIFIVFSVFLLLIAYPLSLSFADDTIDLEAGTSFRITNDDQSTTYMILQQSTGRVGIGHETPSAMLHVDSNDTNDVAILTLENNAGSINIIRVDGDPDSGGISGSSGDLALDETGAAFYIHDGTDWGSPVVDAGTVQILKSTATIASGATESVTHLTDGSDSRQVQVFCDDPTGSLISDSMTPYDPLNYSTLDANINNSNITDLWYNNSITGSTGKWIGLDSGSSATVGGLTVYDYQPGNYFCTSISLDHSANGSVWTTGWSTTSHTKSGATGTTYTVSPTITNRYFRIICNGGAANATYFVLHELELFSAPSALKSLVSPSEMKVTKTSATQTDIENQTTTSRDCDISILGNF